jgi:hypothetical protein
MVQYKIMEPGERRRRRAATDISEDDELDDQEWIVRINVLAGPAGGLRISYEDLDGHYLRGEGFVELVRSGYIGTRGATTEHLQALVEASLDGGKAVVAGIQSALARAAR